MMPITNAQLADAISDLISRWRTRETEMRDWISGAATGGPYGDGRFPLTDFVGVVRYTYSPAALESGVASSATSASSSATLAVAAKAAAVGAQNAAEVARDLALSHKADAQSQASLASSYKDEAANSAANAQVFARNAATSASSAAQSLSDLEETIDAAVNSAVISATAAAAASASSAASSASAAQSYAVSAAAAANDAELSASNSAVSSAASAASAAAAATFNPASYAALADSETITGSWLHSGSVVGPNVGAGTRGGVAIGVNVPNSGTVLWIKSDAGTNQKYWRAGTGLDGANVFSRQIVDDAWTASVPFEKVTRNANSISSIELLAPLTQFTTSQPNYTYNDGVLRMVNTHTAGQSAIDSYIGGTLRGRIRNDYVGNMIYVARGGEHWFVVGDDDWAGGTMVMQLTSTGIVRFRNNVWHGSMDGRWRFYFAENNRTYFGSQNGYEWRDSADRYIAELTNDGNLYTTGAIVAGTDIYMRRNGVNHMVLSEWNDGWLRINQNGNYGSGVYTPGNLRVDGTINYASTNAYIRHGSGFMSGVVYVQQGGSPSGGNDGDIWLIW